MSMSNLNHAVLTGNLVRDPELRYLPSGTALVEFTIGVNRSYKVKEEWREEGAFIPVKAWGKTAEWCGNNIGKGSSVLVSGRITSESWETRDGQKRSAVKVNADSVTLMGKPANRSANPAESTPSAVSTPETDEVPF
jgi:single-strand DNA-binding protein